MSMTIDGTSGLTFPNGSGQNVGAVGVGQTWQNMTTNRVYGTTYTNDTGKPIMVSIVNQGQGGVYFQINGMPLAQGGSVSTQTDGGLTIIVPNGNTYSATGGNRVSWYELR